MEIDFLILSDSAQVAEGKLYMLGGGWDRLAVIGLPAVQPMGIAVGLLVPWGETNVPTNLWISIEDDDGGAVMPSVSARVEVGRPTGIPPGSEQRVILAFNVQVALPRLGGYAVIAGFDDGAWRRHRFTVQAGPNFRPPEVVD
jgi:hypothetical protein